MRRRGKRIPVEDLFTLWAAAAVILNSPEVRLAWQEHVMDQGHDPEPALREIAGAVARVYPVIARYAGLRLTDGPLPRDPYRVGAVPRLRGRHRAGTASQSRKLGRIAH